MLSHLSIRNYLLVESVDLDFAPGLTVLTGETGAGKSILIDALALALGDRAEGGVVRQGAPRAEIAAEFMIDGLPQQGVHFGFPQLRSFTPARWLAGGDSVRFGAVELQVRHCPGHTPGHVIFFSPEQRLALVGDVLFAGSIGRTDLARGDHATLIRSIREQLWPLGDDVTFIPGHGPTSTFGAERASNPFVADRVLERAQR